MTNLPQVTNKGVVPSVFLDEISPSPRAHPDEWVREINGALFLADLSETDWRHKLTHGEAVEFSRLCDWPPVNLTIGEDGAYELDPPAPVGAEQVMIDSDPETMAPSVTELIDILCESGDGAPGEEHSLVFYTWSDEIWSFDAETRKFTRGAA